VAIVRESELDQRNRAAGCAVRFGAGVPGILRADAAVRGGRLQPQRPVVLGPSRPARLDARQYVRPAERDAVSDHQDLSQRDDRVD